MGEKGLAEAYILGIPFGLFGAHHFYLGRKFFGILYACTLGLFGLGYLYDLVRMRWLVKHANRFGTDKKMVTDCYLIGFLGGLFGAHHFYLGNKKLGIFYACTLGVFTVGWIADLIRMRHLVKDCNDRREEKSLGTAYILGLSPFGIFGAYHYYLGDFKLGLIYTFTFGIFGIGWIVDLFRMPKLVRKAGIDKKSVGTAYIMAFPPFGLFGAHHYFLGNYVLGILYTCTLGIFGMGWIVDLFRMKGLVKAANDPTSDHGMTKITAYVLCISPLGIFGAHHFYLKRYLNGGFYAATLGMFGFGWIFDMFRLPVLYERYANEDLHKYPDEAYLYWFPFGLFGIHQFYLERRRWGILYACTLGCLGIGWLVDGFRLMRMLKDFNNRISDPDMNDFRICRPSCKYCSVRRCQRGCLGIFSACNCFSKFKLSQHRTRGGDLETSNNHVRDDFDVIKEMYPNENEENYNREKAAADPDTNQQVTIAQVQENYDGYSANDNVAPAYDNGTYHVDPGYGEVDNTEHSVEQNHVDTPADYGTHTQNYDQDVQYDHNEHGENYDQNAYPDNYDQNAYAVDHDQNANVENYDQNTYADSHDQNANAENYDQNAYAEDYEQNAYADNYDHTAHDQNGYDHNAYSHQYQDGVAQDGGDAYELGGVSHPEDVKVIVGHEQNQNYSSESDKKNYRTDVQL